MQAKRNHRNHDQPSLKRLELNTLGELISNSHFNAGDLI